jgi:demethylspheroidene O-methyltransferase
MADTKGAEPIGDAYFGFYLLAMGRGRPRSAARLKELIRDAGFTRVRVVPTCTPLLTGLIVAEA